MSALPRLPRYLKEALPPSFAAAVLPPAANPGLVWQRYPKLFNEQGEPVKAEHRRDFLRAFVDQHRSAGPAHQPLLEARLARLAALSSRQLRLRSISPLVMGLGAEHPMENGFDWDSQGLPRIAGSALKGLCRAAAALFQVDPQTQERVLGHAHANAQSGPPAEELAAGGVIFLDALPEQWPLLKIELHCPHHELGEDGARLRRYTDEPTPIPWLALAAGQRLVVGLRARGGAGAAELELAERWLLLGLEFLGLGARSSSGLGRLVKVP